MNIRQQKMVVLFGTNGTGKTTYMLRLALNYLKINARFGKRVLCLIPDDGEKKYDVIKELTLEEGVLNSFEGIGKLYAEDKSIFSELYRIFTARNSQGLKGLCVFDDLGVMLNRRPEEALKMLRRRRQMNMDMIWNFHGLTTDMPRSFLGYATDMVLFKTTDDPSDLIYKLPPEKRDEFLKVYNRVQAETKNNPFYFEEFNIR